jgi:hypothetical protein
MVGRVSGTVHAVQWSAAAASNLAADRTLALVILK